jgi:putative transposase
MSERRACTIVAADRTMSRYRSRRPPERRGKPQMIVSDNGSEFTSKAILSWAGEERIEWHHIAPGKPMQNGYHFGA